MSSMSGKTILQKAFKSDAPVWLLFLSASAWAVYPVLASPMQRVVGWAGDNLQYMYMLGWVAKALRIGASPFIDPHLNPPAGLQLATTDAPFLSFFLFAPLTWLTNEAFTYNLLLFLSYFLSGLFTYLWIKRLTHSRFAGLVSGLIFLLLPYRLAHGYVHLNLVSTQFIPLFFWALDSALLPERPALRQLVLLALSTFLIGAMSQYYLVICLSCALIYALFSRPNLRYLLFQGWKFAVSALAGGLVSSLPYLPIWLDNGFKQTTIEFSRGGSAGLLNFFIPAHLHPLWGWLAWKADPSLNWVEFSIYIGLVALILALLAISWRNSPYRSNQRIWLATLLFAFVMALGTDLHLFAGQPLMAEHPIWLPAYFFSRLPLIGIMRVWARYAVLVSFFVALLAGIGIARLEAHPGFRPIWKFLILALIVLDFMPGKLYSIEIQPRPIDQWIAAQPGDFSLAFIPNTAGNNYLAIYASLTHEKKLPAFLRVPPPKPYDRFAHLLENFPEPSSLVALRRLGFRYIILESAYYDGQEHLSLQSVESALSTIPRLNKVAAIDQFIIYEFIR
jgi:hypothetical protein